MSKNNNKKIPKYSLNPDPTKDAKHIKNPSGYQSQYIAWHLQCMDRTGDWACTLKTINTIENRLHEYEKLRWFEILQPKSNHPMPIKNITQKAQNRLIELGYGDTAKLFQIQIKNGGGKQRLWGLRKENIFQFLWWDPKHEVYPVGKRNT